MSEPLKNFDLVPKKVNTQRVYTRKKKESQKEDRGLLYLIWWQMKDRCQNENHEAFSRYGGRGIFVCPLWQSSFDSFVEDMGPRPSMFHSVERRDNFGPYSPQNCYWGTPSEQTRNKRSNNWVYYHGERLILTDLANKYHLNYGMLYARIIKRGWPVEKAVETLSKHKDLIFYEDGYYTQRGLCKHLGVSMARLHWYLSTGKTLRESFEICLSLPSKAKPQN